MNKKKKNSHLYIDGNLTICNIIYGYRQQNRTNRMLIIVSDVHIIMILYKEWKIKIIKGFLLLFFFLTRRKYDYMYTYDNTMIWIILWWCWINFWDFHHTLLTTNRTRYWQGSSEMVFFSFFFFFFSYNGGDGKIISALHDLRNNNISILSYRWMRSDGTVI